MIDIYTIIDDDPMFEEGVLEMSDKIELFLQEIDILLSTPENTLLGDPEYGCSLEHFLWSTTNSHEVKEYLNKKILKYINNINNIKYNIDVNFIKGDVFDYMLIDLIIENNKVRGYLINPKNN